MGFMEKLNLAVLGGGLVSLGYYFSRVVPQIGSVPVDEIAWKWPMAISMLIFIILLVVSAVRLAIKDPAIRKEDGIIEDERDRMIEWRADSWGGNTLHMVALLALGLLFFGVHSFWIAQVIFLGGMLASLVTVVAKLLAYRGSL
jgi:hypothetical protein